MKKFIITALLVTTSMSANAEIIKEKWECTKGGSTIRLDFRYPTNDASNWTQTNIRIDGILAKAQSSLQGFDRKWSGDSWAFTIQAGEGKYYANPHPTKDGYLTLTRTYECEQIKPESKEQAKEQVNDNAQDYGNNWDFDSDQY